MSKTARFTNAIDAFVARRDHRDFVATHKAASLNAGLGVGTTKTLTGPKGWWGRDGGDDVAAIFDGADKGRAFYAAPVDKKFAPAPVDNDARFMKIDGREG